MHEGHRERMRKRLMEDAGGLADHELLETLLYFSIPRVNTNPLAHELLETFGSLEGVIGAEKHSREDVKGVGEMTSALLTCVSEIQKRMQGSGEDYPKIPNAAAFHEFVKDRFVGLEEETVELYAVDKHGKVYIVKQFNSSEPTRAKLNRGEISRFLAAVHPYSVAVAHNHPTASCEPSEEDDKFTLDLLLMCAYSEVRMLDHVVAGKDGHFSYFVSGKLQSLKDCATKISGVDDL